MNFYHPRLPYLTFETSRALCSRVHWRGTGGNTLKQYAFLFQFLAISKHSAISPQKQRKPKTKKKAQNAHRTDSSMFFVWRFGSLFTRSSWNISSSPAAATAATLVLLIYRGARLRSCSRAGWRSHDTRTNSQLQ